MDQLTEYILIQESKWNEIVDNLKSIIVNAQSILLKPTVNRIGVIVKRGKGRSLKVIERDAIRRIPGFKKDYEEAKRKVTRLKFASDPNAARAAALATALASSTTKKSVDDVIKKGDMGVRNAKLLTLFPTSITQLVVFGLFVTFIMSAFVTDGASILPTIKAAIVALNALAAILWQVLQVIWLFLRGLLFPQKPPPASKYFPAMKDQEGYDPDTEPNVFELIFQKDVLNYHPIS